MRRVALPLLASAVAALVMPVLFMLAEAAAQGDTIGMDDLAFGYTIVTSFALLTSLAVIWPVWILQQPDQSFARRIAVAVVASSVVPMVALLPLAGELPWKAGVGGLGTLLVWLGIFQSGQSALNRSHHIRSNPSG